MRSLLAAVAELRTEAVRLSPVPESQVEDDGDHASHTVVARKR
jgi:hypothetical protein